MKAETMWIIIGLVLLVVVIILACSGYWGCRYWKQRKSAAKTDVKTKQTLADKKISEIPVKQEVAVEEKVEKAQATKDETAEKIQPKPKKPKHEVQVGHPIVAKTPKKKTVVPTQEETPSGKTVEPTVEDSTHPSIIQNCAPTVSILKDPIHPPRPYGLAPH
uniref:Uncharacterized protein n=1 Tax=Panagrolaimus superbus TaxID=310955 RepID=A0A914Z6P1_9BILA